MDVRRSRGEPSPAALPRSAWFVGDRVSLLGRREWIAVWENHEIRVLTRGLLPVELRIDGRRVDRRTPILSFDRDIALLAARISSRRPEVVMVEVFCTWPIAHRIAIQVGGKPVHLMTETRSR